MLENSSDKMKTLIESFVVISAASLSVVTAHDQQKQEQWRYLRHDSVNSIQQRQLQYHESECDDVGASAGSECYNYIKYKLEWPECVTDELTVDQCADLIKRQIINTQHALVSTGELGDAFHVHYPTDEGEEVVVDIVEPPPPTEEDATTPSVTEPKKTYYNRYDMPVNYAGEPHGYHIDGTMLYDGKWTYPCNDFHFYPTSAGGTSYCTAEGFEWSCMGTTDAAQCENEVLAQMNADGVAVRDKKGNFMTPWVRQISPTPYHKAGDYFSDAESSLGFCAWQWNMSLLAYEAVDISAEEQLAPLEFSKTIKSPQMKTLVDDKLTTGVPLTRSEIVGLVRNCHMHLRTLPDAGAICTELHHWSRRYSPHSVPVKDDEIKPHLQALSSELDRFMAMPLRLQYKIEIHSSDADGSRVTQAPKLGHHYSHGVPVCVPGTTMS